jgi:hypothetical protein
MFDWQDDGDGILWVRAPKNESDYILCRIQRQGGGYAVFVKELAAAPFSEKRQWEYDTPLTHA